MPILVDHLKREYSKSVIEGILRALTVKEAKGIAGIALIDFFSTTEDDKLRWVAGNAISEVATKHEIDEIERLLVEKNSVKLEACLFIHLQNSRKLKVFLY